MQEKAGIAPGACKFRSIEPAWVKQAHRVFSPVTTYGGQGVAKRGIDPRSHTALYIRGNYPEISRDEWGMTKMPLEVVPILPTDRLDKKSRLNFGKVHTVEHNLRVRPIGRFSQESLSLYRGYVRESLHVPNFPEET